MRGKKILALALGGLMLLALTAGCNTTPAQDGAVFGSLLGAGAGAIIGNQSNRTGEGALIGAGAGALAGALIGDQVDESRANVRPKAAARNPQYGANEPVVHGRYETRIVRTPSGETYEERVWVPDR